MATPGKFRKITAAAKTAARAALRAVTLKKIRISSTRKKIEALNLKIDNLTKKRDAAQAKYREITDLRSARRAELKREYQRIDEERENLGHAQNNLFAELSRLIK